LLSLTVNSFSSYVDFNVDCEKLFLDVVDITRRGAQSGEIDDRLKCIESNDASLVFHSFKPFFDVELMCVIGKDEINYPTAMLSVCNQTFFDETYRVSALKYQAGSDNEVLLKLKSKFPLPLNLSFSPEDGDLFVIGYGHFYSFLTKSQAKARQSNILSLLPYSSDDGSLLVGFRNSEELILNDDGFYAHLHDKSTEKVEFDIFPGDQTFRFSLNPKRADDYVPMFILVYFPLMYSFPLKCLSIVRINVVINFS
jgi:hypothetical protein